MRNKKLIIYGTSIIAELAYEYFSSDSTYKVSGFTVDTKFMNTNKFNGYEVYPFEDIVNICPPDEFDMFIAIGSMKLNTIREKYYKIAKCLGYSLATYISSKSSVYHNVEIGDNCFILPYSVIQPFSKISNSVFVWDATMIGHHCTISDNVFIASAKIAGLSTINNNSFIGLGALIGDGVVIEKYNYISMGSVINKSTESYSIYRSKPAKKYSVDSSLLYLA